MPWATTSLTRILKHRAYEINAEAVTSLALKTLIQGQMDNVEVNLPELIPEIEADLATLETLDTSLTTEQGSTGNALIQADVLRWAEGKKTAGIETRYEALRIRVARLLSQALVDSGGLSGGGWGMSSLGKG